MNGSTTNTSLDMSQSLSNGTNGSHLNGADQPPLNGMSHSSLNGSSQSLQNGTTQPQSNGTNQSLLNGSHQPHFNGPNDSPLNGIVSHDTIMNGHPTNGNASGHAHLNGNTPSNNQIPIAICGMALRLPGGVETPQQYWDFLVQGKDGRVKVPESRYNISAFYDPSGKPATVPTEYGYFLENDLGALDTSFFSMPRTEVEHASPEQRLMLEVVRETFEDAGETGWRGKNIGCYMGSFGEDWSEMTTRETQGWGHYRLSGPADFVLSNRVSYEMDLRGPSTTTRTACSASLTGLNEACLALSRGDCQSAIIGGTNLIITPTLTTTLSDQGVLAPDGCCKTFSADADGYARGEAIVAVYIKRLSDAMRDGNPIRAVIRATTINSDGKTPSFSQPSTEAHERLMRRAYEIAGITDYSQTGFVECHGTGTPTGDPIETKAVARVFGDSGVYIGSVKPNVGHTEGASGLVSLVKVVLALQNRTIPPNIRFSRPNPNIPWEAAKLTVPLKPTPWPSDRAERASINSFGAGGANAHVIVDSAATWAEDADKRSKSFSDSHHLLLFSANTQNSLTKLVWNYQEYVESNPGRVADLAYTLANRREHLPHRAFAIARAGSIGTPSPSSKGGAPPSIVMVCTGQGAQWPLMGRELFHSNPTFRATIRSLDSYLQRTTEFTPEWKIEEELCGTGEKGRAQKNRIHKAEFAQPLCTAVQVALIDCFAELGIRPHAVVGHSSGEIAAAYASGGLTAEEAILAAFYRGVVGISAREGAMAAVGMGWDETEQFLVPGANIACDNSPKSVTISGEIDKVQEVLSEIRKARPDVLARKLQVDKAYHSHHVLALSDRYESFLKGVVGTSASIPFFSSVSGGFSQDVLGPRYWRKNMESPVLFRPAVSSILQHEVVGKNPVFLEIGPHSALAGPLRQILSHSSRNVPYISAMTRNQNTVESFFTAIGNLYALHAPIEFKALVPNGKCLTDLPRYPWNHEESFWFESRMSKDYRHRQHPYHDLLGIRTLESTSLEPSWRNLLHLNNVPWVRDHRVGEDIVFPMAGYIAIAGEAARQVSGIEDAFCVRSFVMSAALVLVEGNPTEIITAFRRHRLTNNQDSQWWDFTISSYNGSTWKKHCTGQVAAYSEPPSPAEALPSLPRKIDTSSFYHGRDGGVYLGPSFRNLSEITGDTKSQRTAANISNGRHADTENYYLHPAIIDTIVQLAIQNQFRLYTRDPQCWLPVGLEEFHVRRCASPFAAESWLRCKDGYLWFGEAQAVADGGVVARLSGLRAALDYDLDAMEAVDNHGAARLEWGPHIEFWDVKDLVKTPPNRSSYMTALDELARICVLHLQGRLQNTSPAKGHLETFRKWVLEQKQPQELIRDEPISDEDVVAKIKEQVHALENTPAAPAALALEAIYHNIDALLTGQTSSWEGLVPTPTVSEVHNLVNGFDLSLFLSHLTHTKPNMRVLEIGSAEQGPSKHVLDYLTTSDSRTLCSKYSFVSQSSISAEQKENEFPNLEFITLNLEVDAVPSGLEEQYDLVIATDVYTTKITNTSLKNIRSLLQPNGYFVLREICQTSTWLEFIFGTHPEWSASYERDSELSVNTAKLREQLRSAGFDCSGAVIEDPPNALAIVQPSKDIADYVPPVPISVLCRHYRDMPAPLLEELEKAGYLVSKCTLSDTITPGQDVLALLDEDSPWFENMDPYSFEQLQRFLHRLQNSGLFWVTRHSQIHVENPRYAQVIGFARTMRSEMLLDFATCEVDDPATNAASITKVFSKFRMRELEKETLAPDFEYAICDGVVQVGRIYPFVLRDKLVMEEETTKVVLDVKTPGRLNTLEWVKQPDGDELGPDEVEIELHAAGLNFRDVLVALKVIEIEPRTMGWEGAGIIRRLGSKVTEFQVGDRVAAFGPNMLATVVAANVTGTVKIPDSMSFEEASSSFFSYLTSYYSMVMVGGLEQGQSVLIHSACGGVGLAAIQIARMLDAEIYATVGSDKKVQFLMEEYGIPRNRIFNSRDASFEEEIMRETNNAGVDLVLNSVAGELLHASWRCVAQFGKMIELGKRDLIGQGKLDMGNFLGNRSYCSVDVGAFPYIKKTLLARLMKLIGVLLQDGKISPLRPLQVFDENSVQEAFRYMQPGQHIGRVCITLRGSSNAMFNAPALAAPKTLNLRSDASYLLVGGLGGLGRAISTWMVENGARNLIYLSRNAGLGPDDESFKTELESMDCSVQFVRGNVTCEEHVHRAVSELKKPLRGVLHMSAVFQDENFSKMTVDQWNAAILPKVKGAWNLHTATTNTELDFFVLFSSLSGTVGQPGQANYASANTFLDAFVQFRNNKGLAASAIDIGAVDGIGYISQNVGMMQKMGGAGFKTVKEQELLDALILAMEAKKLQTTSPQPPDSHFTDPNTFILGLRSTLSLTDPANRAIWKRDRRMAIYHNVSSSSTSISASSTSLKAYIATARSNPTLLKSPEASSFFAQEIGKKLFQLLLKPEEDLNTELTFAELGVDSLLGIELRQWWRQVFGWDISVLELLGKGTIGELGRFAADGLGRDIGKVEG